MRNRKEFRQKDHDGSQKTMCRKRGKLSFSEGGGGGDKYFFGPKYRPLKTDLLQATKI